VVKNGLLSRYRVHLMPHELNQAKLDCQLGPELEWDLQRRTTWSERPFKSAHKEDAAKRGEQQLMDEWRANIDVETYRSQQQHTQLGQKFTTMAQWIGPQFRLVPYTALPDSKLPRDPVAQDQFYTTLQSRALPPPAAAPPGQDELALQHRVHELLVSELDLPNTNARVQPQPQGDKFDQFFRTANKSSNLIQDENEAYKNDHPIVEGKHVTGRAGC
jgi:hypothetical protein